MKVRNSLRGEEDVSARTRSIIAGTHREILITIAILVTGLTIPEGFAQSAPVYESLNLYNPGSYNYVPSIMYDSEEGRWKAWWCGYAPAGGGPIAGDGIFFAYTS